MPKQYKIGVRQVRYTEVEVWAKDTADQGEVEALACSLAKYIDKWDEDETDMVSLDRIEQKNDKPVDNVSHL